MTGRLILDVSRTLSRATQSVPTGIDRVEMAYAEGLLQQAGDRLDYAAMHPIGRFGSLPAAATRHFLALTAARWRDGADPAGDQAVRRAGRHLLNTVLIRGDLSLARLLGREHEHATYMLMSHHHLDRPAIVEQASKRRGANFVCMVHDLIPIEFKEYAKPNEPPRHQRRIETVARLADGVIVNSEATRLSLQPWLEAARPTPPPVLVAHLGVDPPRPPLRHTTSSVQRDSPYFVFLGTIEPRKNHLLILHLWRRLAENGTTIRLILIGRRGWENEQVIDMVERCAPLSGLVEEHSNLSDAETTALMQGARAVLLPSFAEGYGLPVAEALAHGAPVLCSPLPALREVGQNVPDYLDPLDGPAWQQAIEDYAAPNSPRRDAQLARLADWRAPSWDGHITDILAFTDALPQRSKTRA